jgi:hypothetical protein
MLHVVPAFMFQPVTASHTASFSIQYQIFREYLEEVFDHPEPAEDEVDPHYFATDPHLTYLQSLLQGGEASVSVTGILVNLLTLRPEICALLHIRDRSWYERYRADLAPGGTMMTGEEFAAVHGDHPLLGAIQYHRDMTDVEIIMRNNITPDRIVPAGAGAFWLGIDQLRTISFR